jgi:hypothetical protein
MNFHKRPMHKSGPLDIISGKIGDPVQWTKHLELRKFETGKVAVSCSTIGSRIVLEFDLVHIFSDGMQIRRKGGIDSIHFQRGTIIEAAVGSADKKQSFLFRVMNFVQEENAEAVDVELKAVECQDSDRDKWKGFLGLLESSAIYNSPIAPPLPEP